MVTRHYLIEGKVQGVGFRRFVLKRVQPFGLRGWVRNLVDGRVEAVLQGAEADVNNAEVYLRRGPESGSVGHIEIRNVKAEPLSEFRIEQDGETAWEF